MPRESHAKVSAALAHACTLGEAGRQALILELAGTLPVAGQRTVHDDLGASLEKQQLQVFRESALVRSRTGRSSTGNGSGENPASGRGAGGAASISVDSTVLQVSS